MPRRRAKIAPSQELEIHRYLIAALLTGPRRPQWLRPSNGPPECLFRRSLFFVKRKADEYCEHRLNGKYTTVLRSGITEQLKKNNEVLLVFADRTMEEKRKLREATTGVFTRASLQRFRSSALKGHSMCIYVVIAKSSRAAGDARSRADRDLDSLVRQMIANESRTDSSPDSIRTQRSRGMTR